MVFISIDRHLYRPRKESLLFRREKQLPGRVYMAAHAHVARKDSFDPVTFSNCKRYERDKYYFAKFVYNHLNSDVSSCHLDNCSPFAFLVLCVISGFSIWIKKRKRQMYVSSKFSGDIWWKRKRVLVQAVDLKCLFAFLWQLFITCIPSFWIWIMWGFFLWSWRWSSCFF